MSAPAIALPKRPEWLVPTLLILLSLVPAIAGTARLADIAAPDSINETNSRFIASPLPVVLHVLAAIPFSILGALQFAPALRRRGAQWHRLAGRALLPAGFLVALSGLWMARTYPWPPPDAMAVYLERVLFGGWMLVALLASVGALLRRDYRAHGRWMIRAYAVGLGAGTQVLTHLPWFILVGQPTELPRAVMMGLGWLINVAVAEWAVRR